MTIDEYSTKQTIILRKIKDLVEDLYIATDEKEKAKIEGKIEAYREIINTDFSNLVENVIKLDKLNFLFSFDLSGKELDKYFGEQHSSAYIELKKYFKANGFKAIGDSEYMTTDPIVLKQYLKIEEKLFETFPWLELCAKKIISANYSPSYNVKEKIDDLRTPEEREILKLKCEQNKKVGKKDKNNVSMNFKKHKTSTGVCENRNVHRVDLSNDKYILSNGKIALLTAITTNVYKGYYNKEKFYLKNTRDGLRVDGVVHFNEIILKDFNYIINNYEKLKDELYEQKIDKEDYEKDDDFELE